MDTCMKYLPWICVMLVVTWAQPLPADIANLDGRTFSGREIRGGENGFPVHGGACPNCPNGLRNGQGARAPAGSPPLIDDTPPFRGGLTSDVFQQDSGANGFQTPDQSGGHIFTDRQERPQVHRPSIRTHHPSVPTHHTPTRTHHTPIRTHHTSTRTHHTPMRTHHSRTHTGISTGSHMPRVVSHVSDPGVHIGISQLPSHHSFGRHRTSSQYPGRRTHHMTGGRRVTGLGGHHVTGGHLLTGGHHVPRRTHVARSHIPVTSHGRGAVGNPIGHLIKRVMNSIIGGTTSRHHRGGIRRGDRGRTSGGY